MRLWVFDRSGPYSSEKFDIDKEPERFIRAIVGEAQTPVIGLHKPPLYFRNQTLNLATFATFVK